MAAKQSNPTGRRLIARLAFCFLAILAVYVMVIPGCHESHDFEVDGVVINNKGVPISGVNVDFVVKETTKTAITAEDGTFHFLHVFNGVEYDMGFTECHIEVSVGEGAPFSVDISPSEEPPRGAKDKLKVIVVRDSAGS